MPPLDSLAQWTKTIVLLATLLDPAATSAATPWERLAPLPQSNGGFLSATLGDELIIAGGTHWQGETKSWLDQIWAYAPARNTWRDAGHLPAPLAYAVTGTAGDALWYAGGSSGLTTHRTLGKIFPGGTAQRVATLESALVYAAGAVIGTTLYAVGGSDDQAKLERITNHFLAIDLKTGQISRLPDYPEKSLTTATAAAVGQRLFIFGGARWEPTAATVVNHRTAHAYSLTKNLWETLPPLPHPGRGITAVALDPRHILIAGGYRDDSVEFVRDAFIFDLTTGTYTPTIPLPYAAMVSLVQSGEWLYCLGGEDRKKHRTDAVFRIRWQALLARPRRRRQRTAPAALGGEILKQITTLDAAVVPSRFDAWLSLWLIPKARRSSQGAAPCR